MMRKLYMVGPGGVYVRVDVESEMDAEYYLMAFAGSGYRRCGAARYWLGVLWGRLTDPDRISREWPL